MTTKSRLQGGVGMNSDNPVSPPFSSGPYSLDQDIDYKALLNCSGHQGLNNSRSWLFENFNQKPGIPTDITIDPDANSTSALVAFVIANRDFEVVGTNATTATVTFSTTTGGLLLTTDTGAADQVIITPHSDTGQSAWLNTEWGTENRVIWEALIRTGASVADIIIWVGLKLTNTSTVATDADQAFFRFDTNVANWEATYSIADTDVEADTGVAVTVNTNYYLRIEIDSSRVPHFYINNNEVATGTALTNDKDLIPFVGVQGNAKTLYLISQAISRIIFE